jgi:hypothetical protein
LHLSLAYILLIADGVVEDTVGADVVGVGAAQDADHQQVLIVHAGDGVQHAQSADGVGHDAQAHVTGQPMWRKPASVIRWSRRARLKSPDMANTSMMPTCTRRRTM